MHESLKAEFIPPVPLNPMEVMPVNAPCWCGSGKKWKKCHKDRENQKPEPIGKLMDQAINEFTKGYCLHPDANIGNCSSGIIHAHTVQRKGGLSSIAENGHVISPKSGVQDIYKNEGKIVPRKLGVNIASTFAGFCGYHDNQMFEPVEKKQFILCKETAFLLSFRAIAYEYYSKESALRLTEIQRSCDKGKPYQIQCMIQQWLHLHFEGLKRGMNDLKRWKRIYNQAYKQNNYECVIFYSAYFSSILPIVACGAFHPEIDFNGKRLQYISRGKNTNEHVCVNLTVVDKRSIAVLGFIGEPSGPAMQFIESFRKLPRKQKANAFLYMIFEQLENLYIKPSWWESQSEEIKNDLLAHICSGVPFIGSERTSASFVELKHILSSAEIEQELSS